MGFDAFKAYKGIDMVGVLIAVRYWGQEMKWWEGHGWHAPDKVEWLFLPTYGSSITSPRQSRKSPMEFGKQLANGEPMAMTLQLVSPGLHVLSNAKLDSPWPMVDTTKVKFPSSKTSFQLHLRKTKSFFWDTGALWHKEYCSINHIQKKTRDLTTQLPHSCML
ncbi:hypothetical protein GQ457_01G008530 [Hibiscus cannabinus]